jgi:hypothetical protein
MNTNKGWHGDNQRHREVALASKRKGAETSKVNITLAKKKKKKSYKTASIDKRFIPIMEVLKNKGLKAYYRDIDPEYNGNGIFLDYNNSSDDTDGLHLEFDNYSNIEGNMILNSMQFNEYEIPKSDYKINISMKATTIANKFIKIYKEENKIFNKKSKII